MQVGNDSLARVRIRALMKLMVLGAALLLVGIMLRYAFSGSVDTGGETLRVDLAEIAPGEAGRFIHGNRHVLVVHRDAAWQAALADDDELLDPAARRGQQPDGLALPLRSFRPEWLVVIGESTDLGCELDLVHPEEADGWSGGFVDRCRGGRYDGAGRVYAEQSARRNLPIPDYRFAGDDRLILGSP